MPTIKLNQQLKRVEIDKFEVDNEIVFDISLMDNSILKVFDNVGYLPSIGFIAIIDYQKGDYKNMAIAYLLARDIALNAKLPDLDLNILMATLKRNI